MPQATEWQTMPVQEDSGIKTLPVLGNVEQAMNTNEEGLTGRSDFFHGPVL